MDNARKRVWLVSAVLVACAWVCGWVPVATALEMHVCEAGSDVPCAVGDHWVETIPYTSPNLQVVSLQPNSGPVSGGTEVEVQATGVRDFGRLMRCRFGDVEVVAKLRVLPGGSTNPYSGTSVVCEAPRTTVAGDVAVEISLTGETFTSSGVRFSYYDSPTLLTINPTTSSTVGGQVLTITGSGFLGLTASESAHYTRMCSIATTTLPTSQHQVPTRTEVSATLLHESSDTILACTLPALEGGWPRGEVRVRVSLNGQDFTTDELSLSLSDYWITPHASGTPPSGRVHHTVVYSSEPSPRLVVFGGFNGVMRQDVHLLYLDSKGSFYPSASSLDITWSDMSDANLSPGDRPSARAQHTATVVEGSVFVFGGVSDYHAAPLSSMHRLDLNSMAWEEVAQSGTGPSARALHTATALPSLQLFVFGGIAREACGYGGDRLCAVAKSDAFVMDTSTFEWWPVVSPSNGTARAVAGHTATLVEETVWIVGGRGVEGEETVLGAWVQAYSTRTSEWTNIEVTNLPDAVPEPRELHAAALAGTRHVAVYGGRGVSGALSDLWLLDTVSLSWELLSFNNAPSARFGARLVAISPDSLLLWGGMDSTGAMQNSLHQLSPFDDSGDA